MSLPEILGDASVAGGTVGGPALVNEVEKRPDGCVCTWEFGDSDCPVHPTCPGCGLSSGTHGDECPERPHVNPCFAGVDSRCHVVIAVERRRPNRALPVHLVGLFALVGVRPLDSILDSMLADNCCDTRLGKLGFWLRGRDCSMSAAESEYESHVLDVSAATLVLGLQEPWEFNGESGWGSPE